MAFVLAMPTPVGWGKHLNTHTIKWLKLQIGYKNKSNVSILFNWVCIALALSTYEMIFGLHGRKG